MTGDTIGVLAIRPRRFFESTLGKRMFGDRPPKRFAAHGVDLLQIEEVVLWISDRILSKDEPPLVRIGVRSTEKVDARAIGFVFQMSTFAFQADEQTVLLASQEGLDAMLAERREVNAALSDRVGRIPTDSDVAGVFHFRGRDPLAPLEAFLKANGVDSPQTVAFIDAMKPLREIGRHSEWASIDVDFSSADWLTFATESRTVESATTVKATIDGAVKAVHEALEGSPFAASVTPYLDRLAVTIMGARTTAKLTPGEELTAQTVALLSPEFKRALKEAERQERWNDLKQISQAMYNAHDTQNRFPPWRRPNGPAKQPHLSWRVHLLPFIDQVGLYEEFHLDEPWDSEHNRKLLPRMPKIYRTDGVADATKTSLMIFTGPDTAFPGGYGISLLDMETDGAAYTLLMAEAGPDVAVSWTKPDEIVFDPVDPWKGLGKIGGESLLVLFADGRPQFLPRTTSSARFKALVTPAGRDDPDAE